MSRKMMIRPFACCAAIFALSLFSASATFAEDGIDDLFGPPAEAEVQPPAGDDAPVADEGEVDDLFGDPSPPADKPADDGEVDDLFGDPTPPADKPADDPAVDDLFGDPMPKDDPPTTDEKPPIDDLFGEPKGPTDPPAEEKKPTEKKPLAGLTVDELIEQVSGDDVEIQIDAISDLAEMGPGAAPALDALRNALQSSDPVVRAHAARALGSIGEAAKPAAEDLAALLTDEDPLVRRWVVDAFADIKPGKEMVSTLMLKALQDKDPSVVLPALQAMAESGAEVVPAMMKALEDERTQYWALLVLHELGPDAKPAIPAIEQALASDLPEVRLEAVMTLGSLGELAGDSAGKMAKLLEDDESGVRLAAVFALGQIGEKAKDHETAIVAAANDGDMMMEAIAIFTLARLNPDSEKLRERALPRMMKVLKEGDAAAKNAAVRTIYEMNVPRDILRPQFQELLQTADEETINTVLDAIAALGPEVVPRLVEALETEKTRLRIIEIFGRMGEDAKAAAPALAKHAKDEDAAVRREVLFTLGSIGPSAAEVGTPVAIAALNDDDEDVRLSAVYALGQFGPLAEEAEKALRSKIDGDDPFLSIACAWALVHIDPDDEETVVKAVPLLIGALDNDRSFVRMEAINALGMIGPAAKPALEKLQKMAASGNADQAAAAKAAIEKISAE